MFVCSLCVDTVWHVKFTQSSALISRAQDEVRTASARATRAEDRSARAEEAKRAMERELERRLQQANREVAHHEALRRQAEALVRQLQVQLIAAQQPPAPAPTTATMQQQEAEAPVA